METVSNEELILLDYLFGEFKHPIEDDEDYQELGFVFDEDERLFNESRKFQCLRLFLLLECTITVIISEFYKINL